MRISHALLAGGAGLLLVAGSTTAAVSGDDDDIDMVHAKLTGYEEVPSISTPARGRFHAELADGEITYTLTYRRVATPVQQSHIHFGQFGVNGGVSAFLCSNLGNGPTGTPTCPQGSGQVTGVITAASVVGPSGQGIAAGELEELMAAIDQEVAYVNLHTDQYPAGEIRGQLDEDD